MMHNYFNARVMKKGNFLPYIFTAAFVLFMGLRVFAQGPCLLVEVAAMTGACNGDYGTVVVSASGGTVPYSYAWSNGATGSTVTGLAAGTYTVTATDAVGLSGTATVEVPTITELNVGLLVTKATCPGVNDGSATAVVVPALGSYDFSWSVPGAPNAAQITGLAAGTFFCVTVTDQVSGCTGTACGHILSHHKVKLEVTEIDASCAGAADGSATATASLGSAPYTFLWDLGNTTVTDVSPSSSTVSGLSPGIYTVSVTDNNGCTALGAASIDGLEIPIADLSFNITECDADSNLVKFQLIDNSSVPPPATVSTWFWQVSWSTGVVTFSVQNPPVITLPGGESGIVKLVVQTNTGCTDSLSIPFTLPLPPQVAIDVSPSGIACAGVPVTFTVTGSPAYQYAWSPITYLDLSNGPMTVVANPPATATYTLSASQGLCTAHKSVTVTRPPAIDIDLPGDTLVTCADSATFTLVPIGLDSLTWYDANNQPLGHGTSLTVPAGVNATYVVVGIDTFGCVSSDTAWLFSTGLNMSIQVPPASLLCAGAPVTLIAIDNPPAGPLTYFWSSPNPNVQIIGGQNDTVTVIGPPGLVNIQLIATNDNECADTTSVNLDLQPSQNLAGDVTIDLCNGLNVGFDYNGSLPVSWNFGDGTQSNLAHVVHPYGSAGQYHVTLSSSLSCVTPFDSLINVLATASINADFTATLQSCLDSASFLFEPSGQNMNPVTWQWTFLPSGAQSNLQNPVITFGQDSSVIAQLIVTDANGCADTTSQNVEVDIIQTNIEIAQGFCPGEMVALNPGGNTAYTYNWQSTPPDPNLVSTDPNPVVSPGVPTTYHVTIVNGICSVTDSVVVTPNAMPDAAFTATLQSCIDSASFLFQPSGQNPGTVIYYWSFQPSGQSSSLPNPVVVFGQDSVITAQLIVSYPNGCADTTSQNVEVDIIQTNIENAQGFCPGEMVALNPGGNTAYTYNWQSTPPDPNLESTDPNPVVSPGVPTTYHVTIVNGICSVTDSVVVTPNAMPDAAFTATLQSCLDSASFLFQPSGQNPGTVIYYWSFQPSGQSSSLPNPVIVFGQDSVITAQLIVSYPSGCADTTSQNVEVDIIQTNIENAQGFCPGEMVALNPGGNTAYTYNWQSTPPDPNLVSTDPNPVVSPGVPTTYHVTIVNGICSVTDSVVVTPNAMPDAAFTAILQSCIDSASFLFQPSGQNPGTVIYHWSFQPSGQSSSLPNPVIVFGQDSVITAQLIVSYPSGCADTTSQNVEVDIVQTNIENALDFCAGLSVALNPGGSSAYTYNWQSTPPDQNLIASDPNPVVSPGVPTTYHVTIVNGVCSVTDSVAVTPNAAPDAAFTAELQSCLDSASFLFQPSGQNPGTIIYHWSFQPSGQSSSLPNPVIVFGQDSVITAQLIVSYPNGCADTTSQNVEVDIVQTNIENALYFCAGLSVALNPGGSSAYTYNWQSTPPDPNLVASDPNPVVSPGVPTIYHVTIVNGVCSVTDSVLVTPNAAPDAAFTAELQSCLDSASFLFQPSGQNPGTVSWHWLFQPSGNSSNLQNPVITFGPDSVIVAQLIVTDVNGCVDTTSQNVEVDIVQTNIENALDFCAGLSVALNPGGSSAYTYNWQSTPPDPNLVASDPNPVVTPGVPTTYHVTIVNGVCSVTDSVAVTPNAAPDAAFTAELQSCLDSASFLFQPSGQNPGTVSWHWLFQPSGNSSNLQNPVVVFGPDSVIVAQLIVTDVNGCADTTSQNVEVDIVQTNIENALDFCAGLSVALNPGGSSAYTYNWQSTPPDPNLVASDPNPVVSPGVPTTYHVTIVNGVCSVTDSVAVTPNAAPDAAFTAELQSCLDSASFLFQPSGQNPGTVSWHWLFQPSGNSSNLQNPVITFGPDSVIVAQLIVTDVNGCADTTSQNVEVDIVQINIEPAASFCLGDSVALNPNGSTNYTYNWQAVPADPNLVPSDPNPVVSPLVPTTYTAVITNGLCSVTQSVAVTPNPAANLSVSADVTSCDSSAVTISASSTNALFYKWSVSPSFTPVLGNNPSLTVIPTPNTYYYVQVSNTEGCVAIDSVLVDNNQVDIVYDPEYLLCSLAAFQLNIQNLDPQDELSYAWTPDLPSVPNPMVEPTVSTTYTAIVSNASGCKDTAVIQVHVANLDISAHIIGADTILLGDTTLLVVTATGGTQYAYQWSPESALTGPLDGPSVIASPTETTTYAVTVTDIPTGCTAETTLGLNLIVLESKCDSPFIFVPTVFTPNGDGNNDLLIARTINVTELHFMVYNRWGEKMYETTEVLHSGWDGTDKGRQVTPDSYGWYLRAVCEDGDVFEGKGNVTLMR